MDIQTLLKDQAARQLGLRKQITIGQPRQDLATRPIITIHTDDKQAVDNSSPLSCSTKNQSGQAMTMQQQQQQQSPLMSSRPAPPPPQQASSGDSTNTSPSEPKAVPLTGGRTTNYPPKVAGQQQHRPYVMPQPGSKEALRMRQRQERQKQSSEAGSSGGSASDRSNMNMLGLDTRASAHASPISSQPTSPSQAMGVAPDAPYPFALQHEQTHVPAPAPTASKTQLQGQELGLTSPRLSHADLPCSLPESENAQFSQGSSSNDSNLSHQIVTPDYEAATFSRDLSASGSGSRLPIPLIISTNDDEFGFAGLQNLFSGVKSALVRTRLLSTDSDSSPISTHALENVEETDIVLLSGRTLPKAAKGEALHHSLWKPDALADTCDQTTCSATFSLTIRRHHCRSCGGVFCNQHSSFGLLLYYAPETETQKGSLKMSRACEDCFNNKTRPQSQKSCQTQQTRTVSLEASSDDEFSELKSKPLLAQQVPQQPRRMFSNPPTPISGSPTQETTRERNSSRSNSRYAAVTLSRQSSQRRNLSSSRPVFSPSTEALRPPTSPNTSGYFPAMPPANRSHPLPGEETNPTVSGVLATYPLAHKPGSGLSTPTTTSPYGSTANLAALGTNSDVVSRPSASRSASTASMRRNVPANMKISNLPQYSPGDDAGAPTQSSSNREWVPSAWGYDRKTFDPDMIQESSDEESDDEMGSSAEVKKQPKKKLIVDGNFRFRAAATEEENKANHTMLSTSIGWATF